LSTIVISGVKGVGKTTLAARLGALLNLPYADYADYMLEVTGLSEKALLDALPTESRTAAIRAVCELFEERSRRASREEGYLLLTNHLTIIEDGKIAAPDRSVHRSLHMLGLVVVTAAAQEILDRRQSDARRPRPADSAALIRAQQRSNAVEAHVIATTHAIPLRFFWNRTGAPPIERLAAWIATLRGGTDSKGRS
jgi:adenylate kinase